LMSGVPSVGGSVQLLAENADISQDYSDLEQGTSTASTRQFSAALTVDATIAIACSDGESQNGTTREEFREHIRRLEEQSASLGELWATLRLACIHYGVRAHYRFTDDWVANTSHPIMEIGNTADPVTPGRYAKKMAKGFKGAVALIQDSPGHCSLAVYSNCTTSYVRQYFQTGELPEEGTVCPADYLPFGPTPDAVEVLTVEESERRAKHQAAGRALFASSSWFGLKQTQSWLL